MNVKFVLRSEQIRRSEPRISPTAILTIGAALLTFTNPASLLALPSNPAIIEKVRVAPGADAIADRSAGVGDAGCAAGHDDRHSELCAQWKATDAAVNSARSAYWTMIAAFVGLVLGAGTLLAAWRAAHWAKAAAVHTEVGAEAGTTANEIAGDVAYRQLRAYLYPLSGQLTLSAGGLTASCPIRLTFSNTGATPATLNSYTIRTGVRSQLRRIATGIENCEINRVETKIAKIVGPQSETYLSISGNVELRIFSAADIAAVGGQSRFVEFNAI